MGEWIPIGDGNCDLKLFAFAIVWWVLWKQRNKIRIEGVFPKSPTDVIYSISSHRQCWRSLLRERDMGYLDNLRNKMKKWMAEYVKRERSLEATENFP
ncbi:unnamed protein product [Urochloa decumbens]|uniref:LAGLIDADG homing endonuclease n=1 Tax=Urochloa decumbens TaxID=240449 RepID=A0ABC8XQ97_9POAL